MRDPLPAADRPVAQLAFPFETHTIDGEVVSLRKLRGKVVVLDLISVHCGYCFVEAADLVRVSTKFAREGVVFYALAADEAEDDVRTWGKERGFPLPIIADPHSEVSVHFPARGTPTHVVIDRQGRFYEKTITSGAGHIEDLEVAIRFALSPPQEVRLMESPEVTGACALRGRVVERSSRRPVSGARVAFTLGPALSRTTLEGLRRTTRSGSDGLFELAGVACGEFSGQVFAQTFAREQLSGIATENDAPIEVLLEPDTTPQRRKVIRPERE